MEIYILYFVEYIVSIELLGSHMRKMLRVIEKDLLLNSKYSPAADGQKKPHQNIFYQ
jgi:hypothetical protein